MNTSISCSLNRDTDQHSNLEKIDVAFRHEMLLHVTCFPDNYLNRSFLPRKYVPTFLDQHTLHLYPFGLDTVFPERAKVQIHVTRHENETHVESVTDRTSCLKGDQFQY